MASHIDESGSVIMVDVSAKRETRRTAIAEGRIRMADAALTALRTVSLAKGDALATARIAGIMAVKNTPRAIPLCHAIPITGCDLEITLEDTGVRVTCRVVCRAQTGAEMEALSGVTAALLTLYDMAKALDRGMELHGIRLLAKTGGASGEYHRAGNA
ncbi:MAG: cyclic pyranopterin monophosphate synthase MoaC [Planctomycetes bacterium]|nr:cyclic pyranopterin monophosphate synthase MoaC [Planctomycetota bacterium]